MNRYYVIYKNKESGYVTRFDAIMSKKTREEIGIVATTQNTSDEYKESVHISDNDILNQVIDCKLLSRSSLLSELRDIQEEIRNLEYSISEKIRNLNQQR